MNILSRNNIKIDWIIAYVGIINNWIDISEIENMATNNELGDISDQLLIDLFIEDNSRKEFLGMMKNIAKTYGQNSSKIFDELLANAKKIWEIGFLVDIINSRKPIKSKLVDVSVAWSNFNYPEIWKDFIYYMPARNEKAMCDADVYDNLVHFVESAKKKLGIKTKSI